MSPKLNSFSYVLYRSHHMKFDQYLLGRSRDQNVQMFVVVVVVCVDFHGLCSPGKGFRIHLWSGAA